MRIMIFSDSHSDWTYFDKVKALYNPERIFGLGDYSDNIYELDKRNIRGVRGNSYSDPELEDDLYFEIYSFKFHLCHGHKYYVKHSINGLYEDAKKNNVDIVFYGHTHEAKISDIDTIRIVNPGSISIPYYPSEPTFALLEVEEHKLNIKIIGALSNDIYDEDEMIK